MPVYINAYSQVQREKDMQGDSAILFRGIKVLILRIIF